VTQRQVRYANYLKGFEGQKQPLGPFFDVRDITLIWDDAERIAHQSKFEDS